MSDSPQKSDGLPGRIDRLLKWIERISAGLAVAALLGIIVVVLYQILARYALPKSPVWTEELSRYLFAYSIVLATAAVIIRKRHVKLETFQHRLSDRGLLLYSCVSRVGLAAFAILLLPHAWKYAANGARQTSPAMGIKLNWIFSSTVVFFVLLAVTCLLVALRDAVLWKTSGGDDE